MTLINISESTRGSQAWPAHRITGCVSRGYFPNSSCVHVNLALQSTIRTRDHPRERCPNGRPQLASRLMSLPHQPRAVGALVLLPNSHLTSRPHAEKEEEPHTMPWPSSIVQGVQESFSSRSASALGYKTRTLPAGSTAKFKCPKSHHCVSGSCAPNLCLSVINVW